MISISYFQMLVFISIAWIAVRAVCALRAGRVDPRREAILLLVYICIAVVVRFTFCPFQKVDGQIQPLNFDVNRILPIRVNLKPFVLLFDYPTKKEALLNLIGNTTMFIPLGIVWPSVFKRLNTHFKVIAAGAGVSLAIELIQLLFFERATDIDDLILNLTGFVIGYLIYLAVRKLIKLCKRQH